MEKSRLLAKGRTAEVYSWNDGQVLKLFFDWVPAEWVSREADISQKVAKKGLPVPQCAGFPVKKSSF